MESGWEKIVFFIYISFFDLNQIFLFKKCTFAQRFYQIFETGLSAQSHKHHGRHASAINGYTLAEQKISNS